MLVIRRRPGEAIRIGEDVEIEIIECGSSRVKLGVRAPREIPVWRAEAKAARAQNIAASEWTPTGVVSALARGSGWVAAAKALHPPGRAGL